MIVQNYVHMKIIVKDVSQKVLFNILKIKYDVILKMFWLYNRNSKINWVNKKVYTIKYTNEISEQLEMCLSEYKLWNYKILFLKKVLKSNVLAAFIVLVETSVRKTKWRLCSFWLWSQLLNNSLN